MVRISKLTDYGIVLLTHFAHNKTLTLTARDLSHNTKIPLPTVGKVLKLLSKTSILVSTRGANGGYQLTRAPQDISLTDIISALEWPILMTSCGDGSHGDCEYETMCPTVSHWATISQTIQRALGTLTLEDMSAPFKRVNSKPPCLDQINTSL